MTDTKTITEHLRAIGRGIVALWVDAPGCIPTHLVGSLDDCLDDGTHEYLSEELGALGLDRDGIDAGQLDALEGGLAEAVAAIVAAIAAVIVEQMSADDIATYTRAAWAEGVGHMLQGDWEGADRGEVLDAIDEVLAVEAAAS